MSDDKSDEWRESVTSDGTRYIERPMPNWKPGDFPMEDFSFEHLQKILAARRRLEERIRELEAALGELLETAQGYASYTCSEFCVHSIDKPESCPMNDPIFDIAAALLSPQESSGTEGEGK